MFKLFKKLIPTGENKSVRVLEDTWRVTWYSRYGEFSGYVEKECEIFIDEQEAKDFKKQLDDAFTLIKHTSGAIVKLEKTKR